MNQNNGHVSEKPVVTDATGAEGPADPEAPAEADDPEGAAPRPRGGRTTPSKTAPPSQMSCRPSTSTAQRVQSAVRKALSRT